MELLVTLSVPGRLEKYLHSSVDGIIVAGEFSERVNFSRSELLYIRDEVRKTDKKLYLSIDGVVLENDKSELYTYLDFVNELNPDGIYFMDLAVLEICDTYGMKEKLIYDGGPLMTNSLDSEIMLNENIDGVVIARELTLDEDIEMIKNHRGLLDMQIFGHLKMSTSKRNFLTNYFRYLNKYADVKNKETLTLEEENRPGERFPIVEDEYGTRIYSDFVLEAYEELPYLKLLLKRGIIDDRFIDENVVIDVIRDYSRITEENSSFLQEALLTKYQDLPFGPGYFYQKTNIEKNEKED